MLKPSHSHTKLYILYYATTSVLFLGVKTTSTLFCVSLPGKFMHLNEKDCYIYMSETILKPLKDKSTLGDVTLRTTLMTIPLHISFLLKTMETMGFTIIIMMH